MLQVVKVFSLVVVFGMSLIPFKGHLAANTQSAPAPSAVAVAGSDLGGPSIRQLKLDDRSSASWTAVDQAEQAVLAAAQAEEAKATAAPVVPPRPAATPPPPAANVVAAPTSSGSVQDMIRQAFAPQGPAAVDWGLRVAACESGYNPNAHNPSGASGVFQFMPGTWAGTPYASQNIFDASANVNAAAWYYQKNGGGAWSCK